MASRKRATNDTVADRSGTRRRKRVKVKAGQLVAVPLLDGTFALVHVAVHDLSIIAVHFDHRRETPGGLLEGVDEVLRRRPIAVLEVTTVGIQDGRWPVIGYKETAYPNELLDTGGSSFTSNATEWLFDAYYGLRPWDGLFDPNGYEKQLLPGVPVPPTVRYKRDFDKNAAGTARSASSAPATGAKAETEPAITEGPAEIHIEIKYPGDALPSVDLVRRRTALEDALEKAGAGEVTDAGGGGGVMDIWLCTDDVRLAMPLVEAAVQASGFGSDARIEAVARDDSVDEDEE